MRGYPVSDSDGKVSFKTVCPGWYSGRTVHIHAYPDVRLRPVRKGRATLQIVARDASGNRKVSSKIIAVPSG